ncbi:MAG TPA: hypothetical protein VFD33_02930 [Bacillota bacterium]|nr:hypothetical protein [Bacillota bacterium]
MSWFGNLLDEVSKSVNYDKATSMFSKAINKINTNRFIAGALDGVAPTLTNPGALQKSFRQSLGRGLVGAGIGGVAGGVMGNREQGLARNVTTGALAGAGVAVGGGFLMKASGLSGLASGSASKATTIL